MAHNAREEPKTAPNPDRWYNLSLGRSFKPGSSNKYCTLRYEFKPASIDKSKRGSLHKKKDNRVSVEFQNNQLGKPKVTFEGSSEDYKENDAVLFFDGESFRLEQLHRAVKQLRHVRQPGESAAAGSVAANVQSGPVVEARLSPIGKAAKPMHIGRSSAPAVPVEVERIDIGEPEISGAKPTHKGIPEFQSDPLNLTAGSPVPKNDDVQEHHDINIEDIFGSMSPDNGFDTNIEHNDSDDEIADVDDSGDEVDKGPNAAEALRAQVNAEGKDGQTSSSSSSSGSGSHGNKSSSGSGSGSSSSSSDSEASDEVNSI